MQRSHCRLNFLHGFLGSPQDWEGVIAHLPHYDCLALSYPFEIEPGSIVIGYSMGGRIALRSENPKIVISAHPGLQTPQEKQERWKLDQVWIEKLRNGSLEQFLQEWYAQPLFKTLDISQIVSRRLDQNPELLADILARESLAHQNFSLPTNAIFLHGALDVKYKNLYRDLNVPSVEIPGVGHAAHLEDPKRCAEILDLAVIDLKMAVFSRIRPKKG